MIYFILGLGQTSNFSWDEANPGGGGGDTATYGL